MTLKKSTGLKLPRSRVTAAHQVFRARKRESFSMPPRSTLCEGYAIGRFLPFFSTPVAAGPLYAILKLVTCFTKQAFITCFSTKKAIGEFGRLFIRRPRNGFGRG